MLNKILELLGVKKRDHSKELLNQVGDADLEIIVNAEEPNTSTSEDYEYHHTFFFSAISEKDLEIIESKVSEFGSALGLNPDQSNPGIFIIDTFSKFKVPLGLDTEGLKEKFTREEFLKNITDYKLQLESKGHNTSNLDELLSKVCDDKSTNEPIFVGDMLHISPQYWAETLEDQFHTFLEGKELYELAILHLRSSKKLDLEDFHSVNAINIQLTGRSNFMRDLLYDFEDAKSSPMIAYMDNDFRVWTPEEIYKSVSWEYDNYSKDGLHCSGWLNDNGIGVD